MIARQQAHSQNCDHTALFYHSEREYIDELSKFIAEGLEQLQSVMLAVPGDRLASLRSALGDAAADVTMADITDFGRNPGRILGAELGFIDRHQPRHVRIIGEPVWPGRTAAEYPACLQHEALANIAFADCNATVLCPYDASRLDNSMLADARVTHPQIWQHGSREHSQEYAVDTALDQCNRPLQTSPAAVTYTVEEPADLAGARKYVERYGRLLGMSVNRMADLVLIVTELATNSLDHAGGACRLAFWYDGGHVICEARDMGQWADPLAGRRPPATAGSGPYGLFVVNAIADLLRTHTSQDGTTIHAYLRLDDSAEAAL